MYFELFVLEFYIQIIEIFNDYFRYIFLYSFNFILIYYFKLDQDSKNFLFNFLKLKFYNTKNNNLNDINKK